MHDYTSDGDPRPISLEAGDRLADGLSGRVGSDALSPPDRSRRLVAGAVAVLLVIHGALVGYSATMHSPTLNEPGHLVAGLVQWRFGRFEVYRVNPPLVHYAAALPVMLVGYHPNWASYSYESTGARSEIVMGEDFIRANGERSAWLITVARWGCLPFTLAGGLFCFFWSRELWGSSTAGLISLFVWCFEPFLMAHAELITTDCAATSIGIGASFFFWRWLKHPSWRRALATGAALGLAQLTKTTWIVLFGLWPALWLFWIGTRRGTTPAPYDRSSTVTAATQLAVLLVFGVYVLNLGYFFDGTLTKLGDYTFTSRSLSGAVREGAAGNRFAGTWLGKVPVPLPRNYVLGIDLQKKDFENYDSPWSFLLGEWKDGGWWYYYLYGLSAKTTLGLQALVGLGVLTVLVRGRRNPNWHQAVSPTAGEAESRPTVESESLGRGARLRSGNIGFRDLVILAAPGVTVLTLVSSQLRFNQHVRYALPALGFAIVFTGSVAWWFEPGRPQRIRPRTGRATTAEPARPVDPA
jgi:hypothetical protein